MSQSDTTAAGPTPQPSSGMEVPTLPALLVVAAAVLVTVVIATRPSPQADPLDLSPHEVAVTDANYAALAQDHPVVLIDFSASWCGPCRQMAPIVQELAEEYDGRVKVGVVNIDDTATRELQLKFKVNGIPHFAVVQEGVPVRTLVGAVPEAELREAIDAALL